MSAPRRFRHGLVIGKFYPFHAGHQALVRAATSSCDRVTVEVMVHGVESIPAAVRVGWVRGEHPEAHVVAAFDDTEVDFDSPEVWDLHMAVIASHLDRPVDAVFSSDAYGAELARRLGASWVQVDPGRASTPISGTAIRDDPEANWWALPTPVRRWFTKRVVVLGAEPSQVSALANALGGHYDTAVVPSFAPERSSDRSHLAATPRTPMELDLMAREQVAAQDGAAGQVHRPLLICETDVLAIPLGQESLVDRASLMLLQARPALNLLIGDQPAWTSPDDHEDEDGPQDGVPMQQRRRDQLELARVEGGVPWLEVSGTPDERLSAAVTAVDEVIAAGWTLAAPLG